MKLLIMYTSSQPMMEPRRASAAHEATECGQFASAEKTSRVPTEADGNRDHPWWVMT
jgi:hypothetical protein